MKELYHRLSRRPRRASAQKVDQDTHTSATRLSVSISPAFCSWSGPYSEHLPTQNMVVVKFSFLTWIHYWDSSLFISFIHIVAWMQVCHSMDSLSNSFLTCCSQELGRVPSAVQAQEWLDDVDTYHIQQHSMCNILISSCTCESLSRVIYVSTVFL